MVEPFKPEPWHECLRVAACSMLIIIIQGGQKVSHNAFNFLTILTVNVKKVLIKI